MKKGYHSEIETKTIANTNFRQVEYTGAHMQLVLMTLPPHGEIGSEIHEDGDQFFRIEAGEGKVQVNETTYEVKDGDAVIVPAGAEHNVINTSDREPLALYTIYAPSHHKEGTIHATKEEADADHEHFDGVTTE